jgi:hypothetical protein
MQSKATNYFGERKAMTTTTFYYGGKVLREVVTHQALTPQEIEWQIQNLSNLHALPADMIYWDQTA